MEATETLPNFLGARIAATNNCFNSVLINHEITYDTVMKGTSDPVAPFERAGGQCPRHSPALRRPGV